jgi:hypothetical protein
MRTARILADVMPGSFAAAQNRITPWSSAAPGIGSRQGPLGLAGRRNLLITPTASGSRSADEVDGQHPMAISPSIPAPRRRGLVVPVPNVERDEGAAWTDSAIARPVLAHGLHQGQ